MLAHGVSLIDLSFLLIYFPSSDPLFWFQQVFSKYDDRVMMLVMVVMMLMVMMMEDS
jgi:hypothetical protein